MSMAAQNIIQNNNVEIVDSLPCHVAQLKGNLRAEDVREILRLGISVERALWRSYKQSVIRKTALINGRAVAMWGVYGDIMSEVGQVWLLTSPEVRAVSPLRFARIYQEQVYSMLKVFPVLENFVDKDYTAAIRLLEIIGFNVFEPEPVAKSGAMFCRFRMGRS